VQVKLSDFKLLSGGLGVPFEMLCGVSGPGAAGAISPSRGFNGQPGRELSRGWRCALLSWLDKRLVVALDPVNNVHAYFYVAGTYFGLHRLPEAEKNARMAAELDKKQHEPRTHFLLAQVYEMQHKPDTEKAAFSGLPLNRYRSARFNWLLVDPLENIGAYIFDNNRYLPACWIC
jgi:hypothetical protein